MFVYMCTYEDGPDAVDGVGVSGADKAGFKTNFADKFRWNG